MLNLHTATVHLPTARVDRINIVQVMGSLWLLSSWLHPIQGPCHRRLSRRQVAGAMQAEMAKAAKCAEMAKAAKCAVAGCADVLVDS